ncbi:MAG: HlyD family efflux transporter periplasmic adaptor subunit [Lacipirellulaceae bacterium]
MNRSSAGTLDRPLRLRVRPDLRFTPRGAGGAIASDPVSLAHHELPPDEARLLEWLHPGATLRELRRRWERAFAPQRIDESEIARKLAALQGAGLVHSAGQTADSFWLKRDEARRHSSRARWKGLASLRIGAIDPEPLVRPLARLTGFVYTGPGLVAIAVLAFVAGAVLLSRSDRLVAELPTLSALASPAYATLSLLVFVALKTVHELGHAVACRRLGGQPRELGLMLLLGVPCPYIDVSDAWGFASRRDRVVVSLGGVIGELVVASIAALVWRATGPGVTHTVALNVVFVAGLTTLLVNLNPLVRYDGYYILSDVADTPNLWSRSRGALDEWLRAVWSGGVGCARPASDWIAIYGAASTVYVAALLAMVAWFAVAAGRVARLEALGWMAALAMVGPTLIDTARSVTQFARANTHRATPRWGRVGASLGGLSIVAAIALLAPWPVDVGASGSVSLASPQVAVVATEGRLVRAVEPGTRVDRGDVLARLENPEVARQLAEARSEAQRATLAVELLERRRGLEHTASTQLPAARAVALGAQRRVGALGREAERLTLRAERDGIVWPAPDRAQGDRPNDDALAGWRGSALDPANRGAWLATGDVVCLVASDRECEVELFVDERVAERVAVGQTARVHLAHTPGSVVAGRVTAVAPSAERAAAPPSASADLRAQVAAAIERQAQRRLRVLLDEPPALGYLGGGSARGAIDVGWDSGWRVVTRGLRSTLALP